MIIFILILVGTVVAVAAGARLPVAAAWSAVACFLAAFLWVSGGLPRTREEWSMSVGVGVMALLFESVGIVLAVFLGKWLRRFSKV